MFGIPHFGWQRVAVATLLVTPLILLVILMTPAWLTWPFLSGERRQDVRGLIGQFVDWIRTVAKGASASHGRSKIMM